MGSAAGKNSGFVITGQMSAISDWKRNLRLKENITVNAIAPGTIETELVSPYKESAPDVYAQWAASNPAGRLGLPSEIGRVVVFLFEEDSSFINGTVIPVDSGFCAGK